MNEQLIQKLVGLAQYTAWDDDESFLVDDYAGGNEDAAYYGGQRDGEIHLARFLLNYMGIAW